MAKTAAKSKTPEQRGENMKVEILEERLSSTDPETGRHHLLEQGDVVTVSDTCGEKWCARGWAKDVAGEVETGERIVQKGETVNPKSLKHGHPAGEV